MNGVAGALAPIVVAILFATPAVAVNRTPRPFDNAPSRRPSVSPYMNLVNNPQGNATNYQSLVRPQMDQSSFNRRQQAAVNRLQQQAAPTRSQSTAQGNRQLRATGHATVFNDTSRYYPARRP